jgi:hypothetical protein
MSLALTVRAMAAAGCTAEQVASVVAAHEGEIENRRATKRAKNAARMRAARAQSNAHNDAQGARAQSAAHTPQDKKEKSPPTPLKEKNSTPRLALASLALVDEPVDATPPSKKIERTESDQKLLDQVTDVWNAWASGHQCPQVKFLTDERGRRLRQRLRDIANGEEPITVFRKVLSKCETSFFIRGSPRSRLKFDQLLREKFLVEMLEGDFEYEAQRRR